MEKLIKQTVYFETESSHMEYVEKKEGYFFTPEELNKYTANVIKQALETAVEEAGITYVSEWSDNMCVDKRTIRNTFEETYLKFKV